MQDLKTKLIILGYICGSNFTTPNPTPSINNSTGNGTSNITTPIPTSNTNITEPCPACSKLTTCWLDNCELLTETNATFTCNSTSFTNISSNSSDSFSNFQFTCKTLFFLTVNQNCTIHISNSTNSTNSTNSNNSSSIPASIYILKN